MRDLIYKEDAIKTILGQYPEPHYPDWYAAQIKKMPAVQVPGGEKDVILTLMEMLDDEQLKAKLLQDKKRIHERYCKALKMAIIVMTGET